MSKKTSQETLITGAAMTGSELVRLALGGNNYAITSAELKAYIGTGTVTIPSTYAIGDILYASATTVLSRLADVSAGSYLRSGGVTTAPLWSTVKIPNTATANKIWYASATNTITEATKLWYDGTTLVAGGTTTPLSSASLEVQAGGLSIRQTAGTYSQVFVDTATGAAKGEFVIAATSFDFVYYKMTGGAGAEVATEALRITQAYGNVISSTTAQFNYVCNYLGGFNANNYGSTGTYTNTVGGIGVTGGTDGGMVMAGYASNGGGSFPLLFDGYWTGTTPASGYATIVFRAFKNNGVNVRTSIANAELAFQFRNNSTVLMTGDGAGNVAIGTHTTISAKLHVISTTAQERLGYDVSNYYTATVSSTGSMTLALTGTSPTFTFSNGIILPAGTTAVGPLKFTSGTNLTTAAAGMMEYNGTNLFFSRTGTTRENVLVAVDNASAPSTTATPVFTFYYGGNTKSLGDPNRWMSINILGTVYKVPLYT